MGPGFSLRGLRLMPGLGPGYWRRGLRLRLWLGLGCCLPLRWLPLRWLRQNGEPYIRACPLHKQLNERVRLQANRQRRIDKLAFNGKLRRPALAGADHPCLDHLPLA